MIESFLESWDLFGTSYIVGWLVAALLSLVGVAVVARDQIFIGAAASQASMLGIAVALRVEAWGGAWVGPAVAAVGGLDTFHALAGGLFSVAAALVTARAGRNGARESHEAVTGWVFLLCSAGSVLVVAKSPHGLEEVTGLFASTLLGARPVDIPIFAAMAGVTALALAAGHKRILLVLTDPEMAGAAGVRVRAWEWGLLVWLGVALGLSIHVAGMAYAFGCLVLPAAIAKNLCREVRAVFLLSPAIAVAAAGAGFVLANHYDYPPGHTTVVLLAALLAPAWLARRARHALGSGG